MVGGREKHKERRTKVVRKISKRRTRTVVRGRQRRGWGDKKLLTGGGGAERRTVGDFLVGDSICSFATTNL